MFKVAIKHQSVYRKIRVMANPSRFRILELTQNEPMTVTELSKETNLAYNKCADYVAMLSTAGLVEKTRDGRETRVKANIDLDKLKIE